VLASSVVLGEEKVLREREQKDKAFFFFFLNKITIREAIVLPEIFSSTVVQG
jgi:hypothetical protein